MVLERMCISHSTGTSGGGDGGDDEDGVSSALCLEDGSLTR